MRKTAFFLTFIAFLNFVPLSANADISETTTETLADDDETKAFELTKSKALAGDLTAQRDLGKRYLRGIGTDVDFVAGINWLRKAAMQGDAGAQNQLGIQYWKGEGVEKDLESAFQWVSLSADQGWTTALHNMGLFHEFGWGNAVKDIAIAVDFYSKAARNGYTASKKKLVNISEAKRKRGKEFLSGRNVDKDLTQAESLFREAAELGNTSAMVDLANLIRDKRYPNQTLRWNLPANIEAMKLYNQAAELGDSRAFLILSSVYEEGRITKPDYDKARKWLIVSALDENTIAMTSLGNSLIAGKDGERDIALGLEWLNSAAELGDHDAMLSLGNLYEMGQYVPQDLEVAFQWYIDAFNVGTFTWQASYNIGRMYEFGLGIDQNVELAVEWYEKSQSSKSIMRLGLLYLQGKGVEQDFAKAAEYFGHRSLRSNAEASYNLGVLYSKGLGVAQDHEKAIVLFRSAARNGNKYAADIVEKYDASVREQKAKRKNADSIAFWALVVGAFVLSGNYPIDSSGNSLEFDRQQRHIQAQNNLTQAHVGASLMLLPRY